MYTDIYIKKYTYIRQRKLVAKEGIWRKKREKGKKKLLSSPQNEVPHKKEKWRFSQA